MNNMKALSKKQHHNSMNDLKDNKRIKKTEQYGVRLNHLNPVCLY